MRVYLHPSTVRYHISDQHKNPDEPHVTIRMDPESDRVKV